MKGLTLSLRQTPDPLETLVGQLTGGNPKVLEGLNKLYEDRSNWPKQNMSAEQMGNMPKPEHTAFVRAAQSND